jgi:hypothetical protein
MQAVSVSFFRFAGTGNRLWAFAQMQFAHIADVKFRRIGRVPARRDVIGADA